jgi:cytidylate kinase
VRVPAPLFAVGGTVGFAGAVKRILIIEREYGCGAAVVAEAAARQLGWRLLDRELTGEIAQLAKVPPEECVQHEERVDSWLYRLGKIFWRGSYEQALAVPGPEILDADRMLELVEQVVTHAAESGQCVIVGRGAPYFLRNRSDTFCVFLYAPRALKIQRAAAELGSREKAEHLVDSVDQGRAAFIRHYFGKEWPSRQLYHLMLNTIIGIEATVELVLKGLQEVEQNEATRVDLD